MIGSVSIKKAALTAVFLFLASVLMYVWKQYDSYREEMQSAVIRREAFLKSLSPKNLEFLKGEASDVLERRRYNGRAEFSESASAVMENLYDPSQQRFSVSLYIKINERYVLYINGDSSARSYYIADMDLNHPSLNIYRQASDYRMDFMQYFKKGPLQILDVKCIYNSDGMFLGMVAVSGWMKKRDAQNY